MVAIRWVAAIINSSITHKQPNNPVLQQGTFETIFAHCISRFPFPLALQPCSRLSIGDADWNWDDEWIVREEVGERSKWMDTNAGFTTSYRKRGCGNGRIACLHHAWKETHTSHSKSHVCGNGERMIDRGKKK